MEALIELLHRQPSDERILLSAIGLCEKNRTYPELLVALSDDRIAFDLSSKAFLRALGACLEWTDVTEWPISRIETVLVSNLPRWGTLVRKDSLADLLRVVHVMVSRGLGVLSVHSESLPLKMHVDDFRTELLRVLWYSSTVSTLFTILKTSLDGDNIVNILLGHNSEDDRNMQSVMEAQEVSLTCLSSLFHLVLETDQPAFNQLRDILKQTGSDLTDSSSLPFVVSVSSFMFGNARPETVLAAANCLSGVLELCELARSVFTSRVGNLHERVLRVALDLRIEPLLLTMMETIPFESNELIALIQSNQELYRLIPLLSETCVFEPSEKITSGNAVALARSGSAEAKAKFLASSLASVEWLRDTIIPPEEDIIRLNFYYSLLQSNRIPLLPFNEPSLSHVFFVLGQPFERTAMVSETVDRMNSRLNLLDSAMLLLSNTDEENILVAIYTILAEASIGQIRECSEIYSKLVSICISLVENRVEQNGLLVFKTELEKKECEILIDFFRNALLFPKRMSLIVALARLLPTVLLFVQVDYALESQLLADLVRYITPATALEEPGVLALIDTLLQRCETMDVKDYVTNLFGLFAAQEQLCAKSTVALLSLVATTELDVGDILASHPAILAAAKSPSWKNGQYSLQQLVWMYTLFAVENSVNKKRFQATFESVMIEKISTAHTSDLATLEEVCMYMRVVKPSHPVFQFTSLISSKSPSIFPKSKTEKLAACVNITDDVQLPAAVPSIYAQRCVWLACDILSSSLREIEGEEDTFHSMIDCCHFVFQYLKDVYKKQNLFIIMHNDTEYVPLSIFLHQGSRKVSATPKKEKTNSLLHSLPSPQMTAKTATLMDSLTPKNSPKKTEGGDPDSLKFQPACGGDCLVRTGLTFVAPSLVSLQDYTAKLVEVLSLCLIQAVRFATKSPALLRPLIDLLMTMQAAKEKLPAEANELIEHILEQVVPKYTFVTTQQKGALAR